MADTRVQLDAERWVRDKGLPTMYGQEFNKAELPLDWGGVFEFDAVSADKQIVASVSTSRVRTAGGRPGIGKFHKIRSDALFLLHVHAVGPIRRLLVFTDKGMEDHFARDQAQGRFPTSIELVLVDLPQEVQERLDAARSDASREVSPRPKSV